MTAPSKHSARAIADLGDGVVLASVEIAAPPERVFRAITDPEELPRWWGSADTYRTHEWTADVRVGGKWTSRGRGADGKPFSVHGEFVEIDPPRKLVQTWVAEWDGNNTTKITYRLEPIDGGTRVTVRHEGFGTRHESCRVHAEGWERVLGWLNGHFAAPEEQATFYFCRLLPPRPSFAMDMSDAEKKAMTEHVAYWAKLLGDGVAIVFGPVADPQGPWGLGVLRARDAAHLAELQRDDPAIRAAIGLRYEALPMLRAVHRDA